MLVSTLTLLRDAGDPIVLLLETPTPSPFPTTSNLYTSTPLPLPLPLSLPSPSPLHPTPPDSTRLCSALPYSIFLAIVNFMNMPTGHNDPLGHANVHFL